MKLSFNEICEIVAKCSTRLLKELHANQQLMIPFNGSSQPYNYMQFIEYLEQIGHYGKLNPANQRVEDIVITNNWRFNYEAGLNFMKLSDEMSLDETKLAEEIFSCMDDDCFNYPESENYGLPTTGEVDINDVKCLLTDEGWEEFEKIVAQYGRLNIHSFLSDLTIDERGLIYIERVIDIKDALSNKENKYYDHEKREYRDDLDYYQELKQNYSGIGNCWTYAENKGEAYCSYLSQEEKTTVTLFGWVDPKDVDWETTFDLMCYEEHELRLNAGCEVQIDRIMITDFYNNNEGKNLPLKGSIIVKA